MITIPRAQLRSLRSVLRRAGFGRSRLADSRIAFRAGSNGLRIGAASHDVAVEYHQSGQFEVEELGVPVDLLARCEGRSDDAVTFELRRDGSVRASWSDRSIPQQVELPPIVGPDGFGKIPSVPEAFERNPLELCAALQAASVIVSRERIRYALDCLQLRGGDGKIVVTDGRQVLAQGGFQFPWSDDILVQASAVLASHELEQGGSPEVGIVDNWVAFRFGPWTIWLRIEREARFPKIDDLIRNPAAALTRVSVEEADAAFLAQALPRLPGNEATNHPLTLDLNGQVMLRGRPDGQTRVTELILSRSHCEGQRVMVNSDREFLARALRLGFREVCLFGPTAPALCHDGRRQ